VIRQQQHAKTASTYYRHQQQPKTAMTLLHRAKYGTIPTLKIYIWCTPADHDILTNCHKHSRTRPSKYKAPQRAQAAQQQQQVQMEVGNVVDGNQPKKLRDPYWVACALWAMLCLLHKNRKP
jgi:hypothetical protein